MEDVFKRRYSAVFDLKFSLVCSSLRQWKITRLLSLKAPSASLDTLAMAIPSSGLVISMRPRMLRIHGKMETVY